MKKMLDKISTLGNKRFLVKIVLALLASVVVFIVFSHNAFFYHEAVGEITRVETVSRQEIKDDYNNHDEQITQRLTIRLLNRDNETLHLTNTTNRSQSVDPIYRVKQQVVLRRMDGYYRIRTVKRDAVIAALFTLFVGLLIAFVHLRASGYLILSLLLNLFYFVIAVQLDVKFSLPVFLLFGILSLAFAASSLFFVLGRTRQMFYTFVTTILSTALTFALTLFVLHLTNNAGVHFEYLSYVTQDPQDLFFIGSIISVLGAIMDGTGDIVAGLFGLQRQNSLNHLDMTFGNYFKSGISIGQEIIGTLTNILFMIFMAEQFPITLLLLKNGNTWGYIATVGLNLGLLQTIISAIGIVLSVPVTAFVTSLGIDKMKERV